jgi:hypothetical protein
MKNLTPDTLKRVIEVVRPGIPDIAKELGVSEAALYRYRDGSRAIPADLLPKLAKYVSRQRRALETLARKLES